MTRYQEQQDEFERAVGHAAAALRSALPAIEEAAAAMRRLWHSMPGMPYTAPSHWHGEQMIGDRDRKDVAA